MKIACYPLQASSGTRRSLARCAIALAVATILASCGDGTSTLQTGGIAETALPTNIVLNNDAAGVQLKGEFQPVAGYLAESTSVLQSAGPAPARATFDLRLPQSGYYEVFAWWPQSAKPGSAAAFTVRHQEGESSTTLDQSTLGGQWNSLGTFRFEASTAASVTLEKLGDRPLLVDALRFEFVGEERPALALRTQLLEIAETDQAYSFRLESAGGVAPYSYRIAEGSFPEELELDSVAGTISGIPALVGSYTFSVQVTDAAGASTLAPLELEVIESTDLPSVGERETDARTAPSKKEFVVREAAQAGTLEEIVAGLPEGEWSKVNLNHFSDAWAPAALRPLFGLGNPTPSKIIAAWSSFAWDSNRRTLLLYGGGHANYRGNEVYLWRGSTRKWERASLPSEMRQDSLGNWNAIDSASNAPASAHTYDNNIFLPIVDRFLTLGGAADANGAHYMRLATPNTRRKTGPYLFDPSRADPNKVGGSTGSHVQRVAPYPDVLGGDMWSNRENYLNTNSPPPTEAFVNGCTAYAEEGGKDVVYVRTLQGLYKYIIHSLADPSRDTWEKVGVYWGGPGSKATCGHDPVGKSVVRTATNKTPFVYWDLNTPGRNNRDVAFSAVDPTGEFASLLSSNAITISNCGLDFDRPRGRYALWCGDGRVWMLTPPATLSKNGWVITKQRTPVLAVPDGGVGTGILGKWEYIPDLDVFMGLQHSVEGNIWIYKPVGWQGSEEPNAPPPSNLPPSIRISQPGAGSSFAAGQPVPIAADASDSDGSVVKVEFRQGSTIIGEDRSAPYQMEWTEAPVGTSSLTAVATDDRGAQAVSAAVTITVAPPTGGGGGDGTPATVTLQRGLNDYSFAADTYLSDYHKTTALGTSTRLQDSDKHYSSLLRFSIFQFEGGPVPNGANIRSATLSLYKYSAYDASYTVHRLLHDWQEGSATWNQRSPSTPWGTPGANGPDRDYRATPDATASVGYSAGWIEFDVTAAVQEMSSANTAANYGWRLLAVKPHWSLKRFHTHEASNQHLRPKLVVTFD
jgi:hypothetical protein